MGQKNSQEIKAIENFKHECQNFKKQDYKDVARVLDMNYEAGGVHSASQKPMKKEE